VRGDYDINEAKLKRVLKLDSLELATENQVVKLTGAKVGFAGPIGLPKDAIVIADLTCKDRVNFEVGANKTGVHLYNINFNRDMPMPEFADIRLVKAGDRCKKCGKGLLSMIKGIEWGHCFKLDTFYSKPHKGTFTDKDGKEKLMWMGSYGIGLGRSMATVVEEHHDDRGIMWPEELAPYRVHLVDLTKDGQGEKVYEKLVEAGVEALWDERDESAGVKFADADLIGCPVRLVVSKKTGDKVEWKERKLEKVESISIDNVIKNLSN
jgi:prolyl-tRNA synthetase